MDDRAPADLANVLFIAAGLGLAFACAYLVRRPSPRSFRVWASAALVAVPGLLLGVAMTHPEMGMRAAYRGMTRILSEPLTFEAQIVVVPRPKVAGAESPSDAGPQGAPSVAPNADVPEGSVPARDDVAQDPAVSASPPPASVSPAPTVATTPPPTEPPSPSSTETTTPPTPTETTPPPPSPSVVTEP